MKICYVDYGEWFFNDMVFMQNTQMKMCIFRCGHHFHKSCLTEWLTLNKKCPLCKQDFRGKEYEEDGQDEEDDEIDSLEGNNNSNVIPMNQLNANDNRL